MKKYILLLGLCCFGLLHPAAATEKVEQDTPEEGILQDSVRIYKGKKKIDIPDVYIPDFTIPDVNIPDFEMPDIDPDTFNFSFNMDTARIQAWRKSMKSSLERLDFSELRESLKANQKELSEFRKNFPLNYDFGYLNEFSSNRKDKTPKKVESKTFSNISEVNVIHKYGNILVRESKSKDVELEIRYFGDLNRKNTVSISSKNGLLSINSNGSSINQVDFIISVPRSAGMNIDLMYGRLKMGEFSAPFSANLSYSTFEADGFSGVTPVIKDKYGKVSIGKLQDINLSTSYSKVDIDRAGKVTLSGAYSDYRLNDVKTITAQSSSTSGDFRIGSLGSMDGKFNYADISVDKLQSGIAVVCNYSDIKVRSISQNANIDIKGNYSDVILSIPDNVSASFDVLLRHGDFDVAKKYTVKYTEQTETSSGAVKKGQIGSKKPTAIILISSNYADVKIK